MSKFVINIKEVVKNKVKQIIRDMFNVIIYVDPCKPYSDNKSKRKEE